MLTNESGCNCKTGPVQSIFVCLYFTLLCLDIATQTHIEMVSVSCQTEISHKDLTSMGNELDDLREQVCELKKKCSIQEDLDNRSLSKNVREE